MISYNIPKLSLSDKEMFREASREELRVLLVLIEREGRIESAETLAVLAGVSKTRAVSALAFWEEVGAITSATDAPTITEEFEERLSKGALTEQSAVQSAKIIRDSRLADMISECSALMGRSALNTGEIKNLTALYEQYALSEEYIISLAAYIAGEGKLTTAKLVNRAIKLVENEIDTPALLEEYISERESRSSVEYEMRKIFGIYDRALSKTERDAFMKWSREYGFFTDIVGEAYDIATANVSRGYVKYADRLLTGWFEAGCRTLEDCKKKYEEDRNERMNKTSPTKEKAANKKPKERYGEFNPEEAFMKALERSYGKK